MSVFAAHVEAIEGVISLAAKVDIRGPVHAIPKMVAALLPRFELLNSRTLVIVFTLPADGPP